MHRLVRGPVEIQLGRARQRQAVGPQLGAAGAGIAFDDPPQPGHGEPVAGAHEAREVGLHHHRQPHLEAALGEAEAVGAAHRLRPHLEDGERVGELDPDLGLAVGADDDRRIEIGHRREVLAHRHIVEQRRRRRGRLVAARLLVERQRAQRQVPGVAQGHAAAAVDDEVGQRIEALLGGQRQHRLVDQPERDLARQRRAVIVGERDLHRDLLARQRLFRIVEADIDDVLHRLDRDPGGRGERLRPAEIELVGGRQRVRQAAAHQQEMHREARRITRPDRQLEAPDAVSHGDPLVAHPRIRLLDDRQGFGVLERALQHQHRGVAALVGRLLGRDLEDLGRRARPGDRRAAVDEEIDGDGLGAAQRVARLDLQDVDAGAGELQLEPGRLGRAGRCLVRDRLIHRLGHVLGRSVGEVAGLELRDPAALQQLHRDGLAGDQRAVDPLEQQLGRDAVGHLH